MFCRCSALIFLLVASQALGQPASDEEILARIGLAGESPRTARRLAAADKLAADNHWDQAVEEYDRVLREAGDELVLVDRRHCLSARRLCHLRLAAAPAVALQLYRSRVDAQAEKWLQEAKVAWDSRLLRRLVDETFCSRFTDQALDLLGDLEFERGQFEEAEHWWRMLAAGPLPDEARRGKDELVFPDPKVDLARVQAKQILARLFRGDTERLAERLQAFRSQHALATGHLAGRNGSYAETLKAVASQKNAPKFRPLPEAWATFAGSASRNSPPLRAGDQLTHLPHLAGPQWTVRLDTGDKAQAQDSAANGAAQPSTASAAARALAYYPLLVGKRVLVADARSVSAFNLLTGDRVWYYDLLTAIRSSDIKLRFKLPADADPSYTLTATDNQVFARLGAQSIGPRSAEPEDSFLVCLNLDSTGEESGLERWKTKCPAKAGAPAVFEGAPLVHGGRVYAAFTMLTGAQVETSLACYDADTGGLCWQRELCDTQEFKDSERRFRHHLLTLAGTNIVYCSHSGAITAIDAASGRHAWSVRYPSRGSRTVDGESPPRGLAPCLAAGGRIFAAPFDFDRILCLDADTGNHLWESTPLEVLHLLGVSRGQLFFTAKMARTLAPLRSIRALDAATGNPLNSWFQPADGSDLAPLGRGLLAGDFVFWPTQTGLHVLKQEDGEPVCSDKNIHGNLAATDGCLIVAGSEYLSAYVPEGRLLKQQQDAATQIGEVDPGASRVLLGSKHNVAFLVPDQPPNAASPRASSRIAPDPPLPLTRSWTSRAAAEGAGEPASYFIAAESPWVAAGNESLFSLRGNSVSCLEAFTGARRWQRFVPFLASWVGGQGDMVLIAGGEGIQAVRRRDGEPLWSYRANSGRDGSSSNPSGPPGALHAFQLVRSRLYFLQDGQRLLALDAESGTLLWDRWAPAARLGLPPPSGTVRSRYFAGECGLVLETGTGQRLLLDSRTGRRLLQTDPDLQSGPLHAVELEEGCICLVCSPEYLLAFDCLAGKEAWTHNIEFPLSLSGEAPQLLARGNLLYLLVSRNYGYFLDCLDARSGKRHWPRALFLGTKRLDLEHAARDDAAAYAVVGNRLEAISLEDGTTRWQLPLSDAAEEWQTLRTQSYLLVSPVEQTRWDWPRFLIPAPLRGFVPRERPPPSTFPIFVVDSKTGALIQRLNCARPSEEECFAAPSIARWLLTRMTQPAFAISDRGLSVALGDSAWGFTANLGIPRVSQEKQP